MEKCKDDLQREFYIQMTKRYGWTKRVQAKLAVKDEYTFDFAELSPEYSEHELEMQLYLTALDDQVKLPDENPSIGIIICKSKDKTFVEYALKQTTAPIGVATYQLRNTLPEDMKAMLLEPEEIAKRLRIFEK